MPKKTSKLKHFISAHKRAIYIFIVAFVTLWSIPSGYQAKYDGRESKIGVSFSVKYAEELNIDWKRAYLALLDEIEVKNLRLMTYWDTIEQNRDEYFWDDLDWQLDQAKRHGAKVTLAVGRKQPRWPECHVPLWAASLNEEDTRKEIKQFLADIALRYKDNQTIESYQIDNEAANDVFGECPDYDPNFLEEEIKLMKSIDPSKLIITNVSNQSGIPMNGPVELADKVGLSIYKKAHYEAFGKTNFWSFWYVPSEWHSLRAALIEGLDDKPVFVHELQAEPWGRDITANLTLEEQNLTMDANQLREIADFAAEIGTDEMYLWGGEWWYWRLTEFNDKELWQTAKDVFEKYRED